jgi:hypothetical protein
MSNSRKVNLLLILVLLISCNQYSSKGRYYNYHRGVRIIESGKNFKCKQKRQIITIDNMIDKQYCLISKCDINDPIDGDCGIFSLGTSKVILEYENNLIKRQLTYKPIYDSVALNNINPYLSNKIKFTYSVNRKESYPIESIDSIMISQMIIHKKLKCGVEFLQAIKGFYLDTIFIRNEKIKKVKDFMTI